MYFSHKHVETGPNFLHELATQKKNHGHCDVIYIVDIVLNYFLWLNSNNC